jgi:hypothetical protein
VFGINLRVLRFYMGGVFAIASLLSISFAFWIVRQTFQFQMEYAFSRPRVLLVDAVFPALAVTFAVAFWTTWKEKSSARGWGIAASALIAMHPLWRIIRFTRSVHAFNILVLAIGILGLVVFSVRDKVTPEQDDEEPVS